MDDCYFTTRIIATTDFVFYMFTTKTITTTAVKMKASCFWCREALSSPEKDVIEDYIAEHISASIWHLCNVALTSVQRLDVAPSFRRRAITSTSTVFFLKDISCVF